MINKRFKDIFDQYIYKGEKTPFSIGTFAVLAMCFLLLIVATFSQISISHPWFKIDSIEGFKSCMKTFSYTPQIPVMLFIIYLLGKNFSLFLFFVYLIVGFFVWPIFAFGGGFNYIQNYLFGYFLGFLFAIFLSGTIFQINQKIRTRLLAGFIGVLAIHFCGFVYCLILACFKVIDFNLLMPILNVISGNKIIYDIVFTSLVLLISPYIKNFFWICMKPKPDKQKLKDICKRSQIVGNYVNEHGQNND